MAFQLIDIIRPGAQALDRDGYSWRFVGKLKGTEWEDKWIREDGLQGVRSLQGIMETFGPVALILEELHADYRWYSKSASFLPRTGSKPQEG